MTRNKLVIWDEAESHVAAELVVASKIIDLKLRKDFIVVICELQVIFYRLETLEKVISVEQNNNPKGICAISTDPRSLVFALPSHTDSKPWIQVYTSAHKGQDDLPIKLFDRDTLSTHNEAVAALALNVNGTLLASGSTAGTNVKIYTTRVTGFQYIKKLNRGATGCRIKQLSFSHTSALLSLTSYDKQTVHIWRCSGLQSYQQGATAGQKLNFNDSSPVVTGNNDSGLAENNINNKITSLAASKDNNNNNSTNNTKNNLFERVRNKISGPVDEHMRRFLAPAVTKNKENHNSISNLISCGFTHDENSLLVAVYDLRFFEVNINCNSQLAALKSDITAGEILGQNLLTGELLTPQTGPPESMVKSRSGGSNRTDY